jgi:hypothetical protein
MGGVVSDLLEQGKRVTNRVASPPSPRQFDKRDDK